MVQLERGGMNIQRWPAEAGVGESEDEAAESERLAGLPEHEIDRDESIGAGLTSAGAMAEDRGEEWAGEQPVPEEEGRGGDDDTAGLPLSGEDR